MSGKLDNAAAWVETQLSNAVEALQAGYAVLVAAIRGQLALNGIELSETIIVVAMGGAIVVAVLGLAWLARAMQPRRMAGDPGALREMTRYPRRLGVAASLLFVSVLGGWSVLAPLESAAVAPGIIS